MNENLVAFLRERIAEDERIASGADAELSTVFTRVAVFDPEMAADERHIMTHRPARVLREVEAKRPIVEQYASAFTNQQALRVEMRKVIDSDPDAFTRMHRQESQLIERARVLESIVRLMATVYADHPDYREEWRP